MLLIGRRQNRCFSCITSTVFSFSSAPLCCSTTPKYGPHAVLPAFLCLPLSQTRIYTPTSHNMSILLAGRIWGVVRRHNQQSPLLPCSKPSPALPFVLIKCRVQSHLISLLIPSTALNHPEKFPHAVNGALLNLDNQSQSWITSQISFVCPLLHHVFNYSQYQPYL